MMMIEHLYDLHPITIERDDGGLHGQANVYDNTGEEYHLALSSPEVTGEVWREMWRLLRAWVHGRQVTLGDGTVIAPPPAEAVYDSPLRRDWDY